MKYFNVVATAFVGGAILAAAAPTGSSCSPGVGKLTRRCWPFGSNISNDDDDLEMGLLDSNPEDEDGRRHSRSSNNMNNIQEPTPPMKPSRNSVKQSKNPQTSKSKIRNFFGGEFQSEKGKRGDSDSTYSSKNWGSNIPGGRTRRPGKYNIMMAGGGAPPGMSYVEDSDE